MNGIAAPMALADTLLVGQGTSTIFLVDIVRGIVLLISALAAGGAAGLLHRWYIGTRVPDGLAVLVGLSVVAIYLNTAGALGDVIGGQVDLLALETAVFNTITFFVAAGAAVGGGRLGDRIGHGISAVSWSKGIDRDVGRIVQTVGRVTTVRLPDEIDEIEGYEPLDPVTKEKLSGQTLVFPRRITIEELQRRFVDRLRLDYGVGHVDVEFGHDGSIDYLAVGGREVGIGATLPPSSAAVAIRADPPNNASPGDLLQVWTDGDESTDANPRRVTTAELRGTAGDYVTIAVDEPEAKALDTDRQYRLVTLPVEPRFDREFAAQLRRAEETMGITYVDAESPLVGTTIGELDVAVVAVGAPDGEIETIPTRHRPISPGETIYAIGRPDRLRKLEIASSGTSQSERTSSKTDE